MREADYQVHKCNIIFQINSLFINPLLYTILVVI